MCWHKPPKTKPNLTASSPHLCLASLSYCGLCCRALSVLYSAGDCLDICVDKSSRPNTMGSGSSKEKGGGKQSDTVIVDAPQSGLV